MKTLLILAALATMTTFAEASPGSMRRWMDGDISADQYIDSIGVPSAPTRVYGPYGETYTIYGR